MLTVSFCTLVTTINPKQQAENSITNPLPHWPGLIQQSWQIKIAPTIPSADGLKICLPFTRIIYFDKIEIKAANTAVCQWFVFNNKLNPKDEMITEGKPVLIFWRKLGWVLLKINSHKKNVQKLVVK